MMRYQRTSRGRRQKSLEQQFTRIGRKTRSAYSAIGKNPYQKTLNQLEKKISAACTRLAHHLKNKTGVNAVLRDRNDIVLLLGEYNYLARQWTQLSTKAKKSKKAKRRSRT